MKFKENASFRDVSFAGLADFQGRRFVKEARFMKVADFSNTEFAGEANFKGLLFNGTAIFTDATFEEADFDFTKFVNAANFNYTDFNDEASFQEAIFNDTADFSYAKFKDRTYFTKVDFLDTVDFSEADVFQTMKINWSQLEGKLVYNDYFYQSLIQNFETLGQSDDWRDAYYEYHVERGEHIDTGSIRGIIRIFADSFLYISCGYGVEPSRPLGWAIFWLVLFTFVYMSFEEKPKWRINEGLLSSFRDSLFLSVCIFTSLGKWSSKWSNWEYDKKHEKWFRRAVTSEVFLGWLLMILFVISLTLTYVK